MSRGGDNIDNDDDVVDDVDDDDDNDVDDDVHDNDNNDVDDGSNQRNLRCSICRGAAGKFNALKVKPLNFFKALKALIVKISQFASVNR